MRREDITVGMLCNVTGGRFPGVWRVIKINPKNVKLVNIETLSRLNAHPSFLVPEGETPAPVERPAYRHFVVGTIVTIANREGKWVVLRDNGNTYSVVKLGGDNGRYLRGVHVSHLTETDI